MALSRLLKRNRLRINESLKSYEQRRFFSPAIHSTDIVLEPAILTHAHGKLLDVGCGDMPYKDLVLGKGVQYDTFDIERRAAGVKYVGDVHDMNMIADASYDSALCLAVLEHVRDPAQALGEIARVLKPGGTLILSVPHLSRLHEEPHDFFRYTQYGIEALLEKAGFRVLEMTPAGGLFSFLGHQFSTIFVCLLWHVPALGRIALFMNKWLCVRPCVWLDRILDKRKIFALGYVCVARLGQGVED